MTPVPMIGNAANWFVFGLSLLRFRRIPCFRNGAARAEAVDFARTETNLSQDLLIVLAEFRGAPGRRLRHAVHLDGAADRRGQLAAGAFERNDDVVRAQAADR